MSKLISLTMVKNEEKIIESFVRYNINLFDMMLIIDNGCTDSTMEIVRGLQKEGLNVEVRNESFIDFEQKMVENKYMYQIANNYDVDWIVPLDADEFLYVENKEFFDTLSKEKMYYVHWKTYVLLESDDTKECCIPKRLQHRLQVKPEYKDILQEAVKVIVSVELLLKDKVYLAAGHHAFIGLNDDKFEELNSVYIAHFPIISYEQLKTKILGRYVNYIPSMTRNFAGTHVNDYNVRLEKGEIDYYMLAKGGHVTGVDNFDKYDIVYDPFDERKVDEITIRYTNDEPIDVTRYFLKQAEILALKLFNAKKQVGSSDKPKVLVYGTGKSAEVLFDGLDESCVEVLAYVDSDEYKQYFKFHNNIIIYPDKIKFYDYDKIIIASVYYDEIKEILLKYSIDESNIVDKSYLLQLSLSKYCR